MNNNALNILVSVNSNYVKPLAVMLKSLFMNNPGSRFHIYLLYSQVTQDEIDYLASLIEENRGCFSPISVDESLFEGMPVHLHFTKEMYYRLLAPEILPPDMDRVLYLDPDIIVNKSILSLYGTDLDGYYLAAAGTPNSLMGRLWKQRLGMPKDSVYFNSGVILFNMELLRKEVRVQRIFDYIRHNISRLVWPDQDVLNALFHEKVKIIDYRKYNYDARYYKLHKVLSHGRRDLNWIMSNTVIIHFCGPKKPWHDGYRGELGVLFKKYEADVVSLAKKHF